MVTDIDSHVKYPSRLPVWYFPDPLAWPGPSWSVLTSSGRQDSWHSSQAVSQSVLWVWHVLLVLMCRMLNYDVTEDIAAYLVTLCACLCVHVCAYTCACAWWGGRWSHVWSGSSSSSCCRSQLREASSDSPFVEKWMIDYDKAFKIAAWLKYAKSWLIWVGCSI